MSPTELQSLVNYVRDPGPFGFKGEIMGDAAYRNSQGESWPFARAFYGSLKWIVIALRCCATEHAWEDDSYAGPESGNMDMRCSRCGFTFHHTLY